MPVNDEFAPLEQATVDVAHEQRRDARRILAQNGVRPPNVEQSNEQAEHLPNRLEQIFQKVGQIRFGKLDEPMDGAASILRNVMHWIRLSVSDKVNVEIVLQQTVEKHNIYTRIRSLNVVRQRRMGDFESDLTRMPFCNSPLHMVLHSRRMPDIAQHNDTHIALAVLILCIGRHFLVTFALTAASIKSWIPCTLAMNRTISARKWTVCVADVYCVAGRYLRSLLSILQRFIIN